MAKIKEIKFYMNELIIIKTIETATRFKDIFCMSKNMVRENISQL